MKRLIFVLVAVLLSLSVPARAQSAQPVLSIVSVALWPEYDQPKMLVIYAGHFAEGTALPVAAEVRIPASVGQPSAVAYADQNGQLISQQYTTRANGDWEVVSFQAPTLDFQVEYYAPLQISGEQRTFDYTFMADYPVTSLSLEVQVPPTAKAFTLDPPASSTTQEADGLTYQESSAGPLSQGATQGWKVSYQKADSLLTVALLPTPAPSGLTPTPLPAPAGSAGGSSTLLIFLFGFIGLVAVGVGAFWLGRRVQSPVSDSGVGRGAKAAPKAAHADATDLTDVLFCRQCGARLRLDSDFCHKCGAPVRQA